MVTESFHWVINALRRFNIDVKTLLRQLSGVPKRDQDQQITQELLQQFRADTEPILACQSSIEAKHKFLDVCSLPQVSNDSLVRLLIAAEGANQQQLANLIAVKLGELFQQDDGDEFSEINILRQIIEEEYAANSATLKLFLDWIQKDSDSAKSLLFSNLPPIEDETQYGGVFPGRFKNYFSCVDRETELENKLADLCNSASSGALVVCGDGGSGKTSAVAFLTRIRRMQFLSDRKINSMKTVVWLNVCELSQEPKLNEELLYSMLIEVLGTANYLDTSTTKPNYKSILAAVNIKKERFLVILDDVFSKGVLQCICLAGGDYVRCVALGRNSERIEFSTGYFTCQTHNLPPLNDVSMQEMLGAHYRLQEKGLDKTQIELLAKMCFGLPLIASLINLYFDKVDDTNKAQGVYNDIFRNFRELLSVENDVDFSKSFSGDSKETIARLLTHSPEFDFLNDDGLFSRRDFYAFLLFPPNSYIDSRDLQAIWKCSESEAVARCQPALAAALVRKSDNLTGNGITVFVLHEFLHQATEDIARVELDVESLTEVRRSLLMDALNTATLQFAIELNRPRVLNMVVNYTDHRLMAACCVELIDEHTSILHLLARKAAQGIWSNGKGCQSSELFCRIAEQAAIHKYGILLKLFDEPLIASIVETMADPSTRPRKSLFLNAAVFGCDKLAKVMLKETRIRRLAVSDVDEFGNNSLMLAATHGKEFFIEEVFSCKDINFDFNAKNNAGRTVLICSMANSACSNIIPMLFSEAETRSTEIDIEAISQHGQTALMDAARYGRTDVMKFLARKLGSIQSGEFELLLSNALENSHYETADFLLDAGARLNNQLMKKWHSIAARKPELKKWITKHKNVLTENSRPASIGEVRLETYSTLHQFIAGGASVEQIREFLQTFNENDRKRIVNMRSSQNLTPLQMLAEHGDEKAAEELISQGAEVDPSDNSGSSALFIATHNGFAALVEVLLRHGAIVNWRNSVGRTPLICAATEGYETILKMFILRGADVNAVDEWGRCALHYAAIYNHPNVVGELLKYNASVDLLDNDRRSSLVFSCIKGLLPIAQSLLDNGAFVDLQGKDGETALIAASAHDNGDIVQELLNRGASVDLKSSHDGRTAIMHAALNGHERIVRKLIEAKASVNLGAITGRTALMSAAVGGHVNVVTILLEAGASPDSRDERSGVTALMEASSRGYTDVIIELLKHGAKLDVEDFNKQTALFYASANNRLEIVRLLLSKAADINAGRNSPLHAAIEGGHIDIVHELISHRDADLEIEDAYGRTPLIKALIENQESIALILIANGACVNARDKSTGSSALLIATAKNFPALVAQMLPSANLADKDANGLTALMSNAVIGGFTGIVTALLEAKAPPDTTDDNGCPVLFYGVADGNAGIVKVLLDAGASVNIKDRFSTTPLILAVLKNNSEMAKLLLDKGADPNLKSADGKNALIYAAIVGNSECIGYLLDHGADIDSLDDDGRSALLWASVEGKVNAVQELAKRQASINMQDATGNTALKCCAMEERYDVAVVLLAAGAKPDLADEDGDNPLICAAGNNYLEIARLLLESGADVNFANLSGETSLSIACHRRLYDIAELLIQHTALSEIKVSDSQTAADILRERQQQLIAQKLPVTDGDIAELDKITKLLSMVNESYSSEKSS